MNTNTALDVEPYVPAHRMLALMGDRGLEDQLDNIRRTSLLRGEQRLAEDARVWLEFSRATGRFRERIAMKEERA